MNSSLPEERLSFSFCNAATIKLTTTNKSKFRVEALTLPTCSDPCQARAQFKVLSSPGTLEQHSQQAACTSLCSDTNRPEALQIALWLP